MRILVEPSDYTFFNIGDTTMLQVAITRLKALFPDSSIQVFTDDPGGLAYYCPDATPISTNSRTAWLADGFLFDPVYKYLDNGWLTKHLIDLERRFRRHWPSVARYFIHYSSRRRGISSKDVNDYLRAIYEADLVVVSGMGGITDAFPKYAFDVLDTLFLAIRRGVPTAMLGQGIGPLQNPELKAWAKEVLPHVRYISLREGLASLPLLFSLGVSPDRVMVTGDDAIEVGYQMRSERLGKGLGVNLRVAKYSQVDHHLVECIRAVIQDVARSKSSPLVPIPISRVSGEEDAVSIEHLVKGYPDVIGGEEDLSSRLSVIKQTQHCRVVVTGSYHAAVFALAMGIPAVGVANSEYYANKFLGLAEQFGTGCQVVLLDDFNRIAKLRDAIERLWKSAEQIRPQLFKAAAFQVGLSQAAYQRVSKLIPS